MWKALGKIRRLISGTSGNKDEPSALQEWDDAMLSIDALGFCIFKKLITDEQIQIMSEVLENRTTDQDFIQPELSKSREGKFYFLYQHPLFLDVICRPPIMKLLTTLQGNDFRLDHAFGLRDLGSYHTNLHGGERAGQGTCFYYNQYFTTGGKVHCGTIQVAIVLKGGGGPQKGGFILIPGSHKLSVQLNTGEIVKSITKGYDHPLIVTPELEPGDVVVFPESLVHGTKAMSQGHERIHLMYNFVPGYMSFKADFDLTKILPHADTELKKRLLRGPGTIISESKEGGQQWRTSNFMK